MAGTLTNPKKLKGVVGTTTLKSMINDERTKNKFKELLGNKAAGFLTSLLNTTNGNAQLQEAEPQSILKAGAIAATLDLPIDPNLGFTYVVPYKRKYKDNRGNWQEKNEAQFQLGYKGFIQLAIRTGQYKKINVTELYEGQFESYDPITDELKYNLDGKISDEVTHYIAYFQTTNGFEKYNVMSKEEVREHAKKFSKTFLKSSSSWQTNFDSMAKKTVLKLLLSKFGILSIEMQTAQKVDQAVIKEVEPNGNVEVEYVDSPGNASDIVEEETADNDTQSDDEIVENFNSEELF
ncbi:recombinase RecT [uncultured Leptotrichia sp.]|uniref:recombinase RecT n=1 Tax=uncultured Leptotrichia sp. TaxID=159271 RepID=UPI00261021BB|nr:recombinase RecT [uncultured Leptotrichia sp.]